MAIRMTGLNSGLDTESIIESLMEAHRMKKTKVQNKSTKLEWKKEIWSEMNTKLYDFYAGSLSKIKSQSSFKTKNATSSDNSKITATANSNAAEGTYKIKVESLASAQYVTSAKLKGAQVTKEDGSVTTEDVTTKSKLVDLLDAGGNKNFTAGTQIAIKSGDKTNYLDVDENTTVNDFVNACKNAGLNANFDKDQQRFFISSTTSGEDQGFQITAGALSSGQQAAMNEWKEAVGYQYLSGGDKSAVNTFFMQLQSGEITYDSTVADNLKSYADKSKENAVTSYYRNKLTSDYEKQYYELDADGNIALDADGNKTANATAAADLVAYIKEKDGITDQEAQDKVNAMTPDDKCAATADMIASKVSEELGTDAMKQKIADEAVNGIKSEADVASGSYLYNSQAENAAVLANIAQNYNSTMSGMANAGGALASIGMSNVTGDAVAENTGVGMVVTKASDAKITFNGATLTSDTSTLTVNGLTLNILDDTEGQEISISVTKDTEAVYDTIKDFLGEYNDIMTSMQEKYNAGRAKGFEPLTEDEKAAMSEKEIELWEDKIKDSLLRRDDKLGGLINSFRSKMGESYVASDGKRYSLSALGIVTSADYKNGGLLYIKGDEDSTEYADENNKLKEMIDKDPELVAEIMTNLTSALYSDMFDKMKVTKLSSALTFYNDKEMNEQLSDYKADLKKWDTKLADIEDRYYKQFAAMENAMAKMNSQQSSLAGFM